MAESAQERRTKPRLSLRLPVEVLLPDSQRLIGLTKDVSLGGVYFFSTVKFEAPEAMEFLLAFPPEITFSETKKVHCTGKVLRIDQETPSGTGLAIKIDTHRLVDKTDSSYPFAMVRTPSTL